MASSSSRAAVAAILVAGCVGLPAPRAGAGLGMTVPAGQAVMKLGDGASSVRAGMGGADSMMQNRAADWTQERLSGGFRATLSLRGGGTDVISPTPPHFDALPCCGCARPN